MFKKKKKAIVLFSGGLDSQLAVKVLQEQNINVTALVFKSCFFSEHKAVTAAKNIGVDCQVVDISEEHLEMVKKPKYGRGGEMNPCIDCHLMMIKKAGEFLTSPNPSFVRRGANKFDFIATGEVLGQRPMSQNKRSLELIEKQSGIKGYVLRPLSAKLLPPTVPEKKGWVKREKLLDISGRSRKVQMELAKKYKLENYENPAGGCVLTDKIFSQRLMELFEVDNNCDVADVNLLNLGRHFWATQIDRGLSKQINTDILNYKIVVGRDKDENEKIEKIAQKNDVLIDLKNYSAPTTLVRSYDKENKKIPDSVLDQAKEKTKFYSTKARDKKDVEFVVLEK